MTPRLFPFFVAVAGLISIARADSILLSDDFSGASLDSTKWTTLLPFGGSSVVESGGFATTTNRGILATLADVSGSYVINGAFKMNSDLEHFNIAFRTGLQGSDFGERQGMFVAFSNDGNQVSIQRYTSSVNWDLLAVTNYSLVTGQTYFFSIFDDGTNVSLAVNGVDLLSAANSYSTGNKVAFYSREFGSSSIDAVNISSVPDGGPTVAFLGLALAGLVAARRKMP